MRSSIAISARAAVLLALGFLALTAADTSSSKPPEVPLVVPPGVPLRLYLTKRVSKRTGAPVEAKVLDPVYVFDHQVIPAGAIVLGQVDQVKPVSKALRRQAVFNGDFTPLRLAPVEFTTLVMPDGRKIPLRTSESFGLDSIVPAHPRKGQNSTQPQNSGAVSAAKQQVKDAVQAKIDTVRSIPDLVRGPDKKEVVEDYLITKLPYHPQYVRKGTRFDAELSEPLNFGSEPVPSGSLAWVGTQPKAASVAHARLITPVDSFSSKAGETIHAALSEPVFSADHKLILPEGTELEGSVVLAKKSRWFHRSGQLRFTFQDFQLPSNVARLQAARPGSVVDQPVQSELKVRTEANLQAAESTGKARLQVDREGGVKAAESKTRFIAAAAAIMVARRAADNDPLRNQSGQIVGQSQNVGGRTIGGGFGFGLLGAGIAQSSKYVGTAFGFYGMAWALYSTVIARGSEVSFPRNAVIDIRFDTPPTDKVANHASAQH
jgi:hypothetical protein